MGVKSVAVYSDADRFSRPVLDADEAVRLGPAPASESYLNVEAIVAAAKSTGAQAVHPGYGFLSENVAFAERLAAEGVVFIGPRPEHLRAFGLKHTAREIARASGAPLAPGSGLLDGVDQALAEAERIGYPVMLKSTAGGGGIGMQLCDDAAALADTFARVQRTAQAGFGDARVYLERYARRPVMSRCRSSATGAAASWRSASAIARCNAAIRRRSRRRRRPISRPPCACDCTRRRARWDARSNMRARARLSSSTTSRARISISWKSTRGFRSSIP
jgi:biotin carboxylase